jgi:hypothetical protein
MMRRRPIPQETLIHEAGHAVGRILVSPADGWRAEEAVTKIEIHRAPPFVGMSIKGQAALWAQASTWGPMFSRPMQEILCARFPKGTTAEIAEVAVVADEMRAVGIDVNRWCLDRSAHLIMGPAAEARYLKKPLDLHDSESDLRDVINCNLMAGIKAGALTAAFRRAHARAEALLDEPGAWPAVLALAESLKGGTMSGKQAADIIVRALAAATGG